MKKIFRAVKHFGQLLVETFKEWKEREPFNNSIIIAYYTIFSLPGLLVIIINLAGYFFGYEAVTNQIAAQMQGIVGGDTAKDVQEIVSKASENKDSTLASVLGVATLLFGATGVFYQLQQILNKMWEVKPQPKQKLLKLIRDRVFSFGLILVIGFLLLVSLVLSAGLSALSDWVGTYWSESLIVLFKIADILVSLGVVTLLFAAIYKFLPDARIRWREVWIGALVTSALFVIAKFALGLYFGQSDPASTYGAAGSIILIMLWVSYSGMILLFGAEFTQVYARRHGHRVVPTEGAVSTEGSGDNGAIENKKRQDKRSMKSNPTVNTILVLILALTSTTVFSQDGTTVALETDPTTFVFSGYSLHVRVKPAGCERLVLGAGTYAMDMPDVLVDLNPDNRDEGWNVRMKSAYGLFGEFYLSEAHRKWFIGEQVSLQNFRVSKESELGATSFRNFLALTYIGYAWHPFEFPLYIKPWAGLGYTTKVRGSTDVGDDTYDVSPLFPFVTFHIGYTF